MSQDDDEGPSVLWRDTDTKDSSKKIVKELEGDIQLIKDRDAEHNITYKPVPATSQNIQSNFYNY